MPLNAYLPLEFVYQFHETAENWILRRYAAQVTQSDGAERTRPTWQELVVPVFPDRTRKQDQQQPQGQVGPQTCTVYLRTRLLTTDPSTPQPADVLFDPLGRAWQAAESGEWDEARGFATVLQRVGKRGDLSFP